MLIIKMGIPSAAYTLGFGEEENADNIENRK